MITALAEQQILPSCSNQSLKTFLPYRHPSEGWDFWQ